MPSDIGRGIKFGIGFALGVSLIMVLFLFGLSMCAGQVHRRMLEQMEEMWKRRPAPETQDDRASFMRSTRYGGYLTEPVLCSTPRCNLGSKQDLS